MKSVRIAELKSRLSEHLRSVRKGRRVATSSRVADGQPDRPSRRSAATVTAYIDTSAFLPGAA
jgi:antitoxin (DNA-binding transcriptional repressor) of toxin-antitoxin stability system